MAPSPLLAVAVEDKGGKKYMFLYCNYSGARSQNKKETCFGYGDTLPVSKLKKLVSCGRPHSFYSGFWFLNSDS